MKVCYRRAPSFALSFVPPKVTDKPVALRLYPTVPLNVRFANKTTLLPRGGGRDGRDPVMLPKGTGIGWSIYHLHRLQSIYGSDSRVYRPERWESGELMKKAGLGVGYVDFNGAEDLPRKYDNLTPAQSLMALLTAYRGFCPNGGKLCNH